MYETFCNKKRGNFEMIAYQCLGDTHKQKKLYLIIQAVGFEPTRISPLALKASTFSHSVKPVRSL